MAPPDPGSALRVRLQGDPAVVLPDGRVVALERRAAALLALAVLEPGIGRLRAAMLLWPDSSDPRRNLRQQLLRFRQVFGHDLLVGSDALTLAPGVVHDIGTERPGTVRAGTLLGTLDYDDCEDFTAWLAERRDALREGLLAAAQQRLARSEAAADLDAALAAANTLLALDDHVEHHHRELMRLHYLRGDNAAGLAAFRRLSDMLSKVYDTRPSTASEQLAGLLRVGAAHQAPVDGRLAGAMRAQAMPVTLKRPPLMAGRSDETAAVMHAWGEGWAVLIEGEAGLGKSRLIAELLSADQAGARLLVGAGRPGDSGAPYATLARMLRPWLEAAALAGASLAEPVRQALSHLMPNAADGAESNRVPGSVPGSVPSPSRAALRPGELATAVSALLQHKAVHTVAVDDLHFADLATLELLADLAANVEPPRRWLFAQRPAETSGAAQALHDGLTELLRLRTVRLSPLDETATTALVDTLAIPGLRGADVAAALVKHTGGNPLFMLETLKQGLADGSLARHELPRPANVGALIERRLQRLSEPALSLARVAAIAGVDFSVELAEFAIGMRAVRLASAWAELESAQIFRDQTFAHDLVLDAARRSMPAALTRHLHGAVAGHLEQGAHAPAHIAGHWLAATEPARALPWLHRAAKQAGAALRRREELVFLEQAAAIEEQLGLPAAFETLTDIWDSHDVNDRVAIDDMLLGRIDRAAEIGAPSDARCAVAHRLRCFTLLRQGQFADAVTVGERGLTLAAGAGAWQTQAEIAQGVAASWHALGEPARGLDLMRRLLPDVERIEGEPGTKGSYYLDLGAMLAALDRQAEALAYQDRGVELALQANNVEHAAMGRTNQGFALICTGLPERGLAVLQDVERLLAGSDGTDGARMTLALHIGRALRDLGRYEQALRANEQAMHDVAAQLPYMQPLALAQLGLTWLRLGQTARAQQVLGQAQAHTAAAPWIEASVRIFEARVLVAAGRDPLPAIEAGLALAPRNQRRLLRYMLLAESLRRRDANNDTLAEAEQAAAEAEALGLASAELALRAMAAPLALRLGATARAGAHAQRAAALADRVYAFDLHMPEVWLHTAKTLQALSEPDRAHGLLTAAARWVATAAQQHVPAPFVASFLHRNAVNAELLLLSRQHPSLAEIVAPALRLAAV